MSKSVLKKICLILAMVMLTISFAACGSSQKPDETSAAAAESASESAATTAAAEPVKLTFATDQADPENASKSLWLPAQEYMKKNPNVTIEFMGAAHDEYMKKIDLMAQSNSLPDLFWLTNGDVPEMIKMGILADMTAELNADQEFKDSLIAGVLDNFTFDGKVYAFPEKTDIQGFFYNKAIFDKYELKIPETWDELLTAVKVLNQNGIVPFAQGTKDTWAVWGYYLFFNRYGLDDFLPKFLAKEQKMAGSNLQKGFERLKELAAAGAFPKQITTVNYTQMKEMFLGGKAAIYTTGTWQLGELNTSAIAKDIEFNWGPSFPDGIGNQKQAIKETTSGLWVPAKSKEDASKFKHIWGYLKSRYSPEGTKLIVETCNQLASSKYTGDASSVGPVFDIAVKRLNDDYKANTEWPLLMPATSYQPLWDAMTGVMNGILTPEQACKKLDDWNAAR